MDVVSSMFYDSDSVCIMYGVNGGFAATTCVCGALPSDFKAVLNLLAVSVARYKYVEISTSGADESYI